MLGIDDIIGAGLQLIDKFIPDKNAQQAAEAQFRLSILSAAQKSDEDQAATNTAEAGNASVFVSGWRPAIGWVCATALAYQYLGRPILTWGAAIWSWKVPTLPGLDDSLWQLMFGLLGLGTLRTVEKIKGASK